MEEITIPLIRSELISWYKTSQGPKQKKKNKELLIIDSCKAVIYLQLWSFLSKVALEKSV